MRHLHQNVIYLFINNRLIYTNLFFGFHHSPINEIELFSSCETFSRDSNKDKLQHLRALTEIRPYFSYTIVLTPKNGFFFYQTLHKSTDFILKIIICAFTIIIFFIIVVKNILNDCVYAHIPHIIYYQLKINFSSIGVITL